MSHDSFSDSFYDRMLWDYLEQQIPDNDDDDDTDYSYTPPEYDDPLY